MSKMNSPGANWDPLYSASRQTEARPITLYAPFATITEGENRGMVWGREVGLRSHLATHLREIPALGEYLVKLLTTEEIDLKAMVGGEKLDIEADMGEIIGTTDQVEITSADDVYYASRLNRSGMFTKFVRGRESIPTSKVTAILAESPDERFCGIVHTGWTGPRAPSFPYPELAIKRPKEYARGVEYWSGQDKALTDRHMEIIPGTERSDCPWAVQALALHASQAITLTDATWARLR